MRRIHCLERKTNKNNNCRSFHGDEAEKIYYYYYRYNNIFCNTSISDCLFKLNNLKFIVNLRYEEIRNNEIHLKSRIVPIIITRICSLENVNMKCPVQIVPVFII